MHQRFHNLIHQLLLRFILIDMNKHAMLRQSVTKNCMLIAANKIVETLLLAFHCTLLSAYFIQQVCLPLVIKPERDFFCTLETVRVLWSQSQLYCFRTLFERYSVRALRSVCLLPLEHFAAIAPAASAASARVDTCSSEESIASSCLVVSSN